jgi:serine/threonine protein phosphatase PrpC
MRFPDTYTIRRQTPRDSVIFAASQLEGHADTQEDYFLNFNDECFVLADGQSNLPNGEAAAQLACDTAIWAYKHIRQHPYYWLDKKLFMKRIFRSTNLAIWQKRREQGFEEGLATTLMVLMVGAKNYWIGHAGNSSAWLYREGNIKKLTHDDVNPLGVITKALGFKRLGLIPEFASGTFESGDVLLLCTDGVGDFLTEKNMNLYLSSVGTTNEDVLLAVNGILKSAETNGSTENMSAILVKRLINP